MNMKHTPGPWAAEAAFKPSGKTHVRIKAGVPLIGPCGDPEDAEANARLIANAPETLDAMVGLIAFIREYSGARAWEEMSETSPNPAVTRALALIAIHT